MRHRTRQHGQALVLFAVALVALIVAVGLVIDVGYAWAQQRNMQNSADAAAKAGALMLAKRAAEGSGSLIDDEAVRNAVFASAAANDSDIESAIYADWQGNLLGAAVGAGVIPVDANGFAAAGVAVATRRDQRTFFSGVVGITNLRVIKDATAVSGPTNGCVDTVDGCALLPVTIPVKVLTCSATGNDSVYADPPQEWAFGERIVLPLCGGNPGSVGWIDWTPPAGGAAELEDVILDPPPVTIPLPSWQYITETGDVSSDPVEDALNTYIGDVVLIPFFDDTCPDEPPDHLLSACPAGSGGFGVNQWYWIVKVLRLRLEGAYINGNFEDVCGANVKECLIGSFVTFIETGSVGAPCPPEGCPEGTSFSVQLIK